MIDRDRFAADIYLRLLDAHAGKKDSQWIKDEAQRMADEFIDELKQKSGGKQKTNRREHLVPS